MSLSNSPLWMVTLCPHRFIECWLRDAERKSLTTSGFLFVSARNFEIASLVIRDLLDRCIYHIQPHNGAELLAVVCSHATAAVTSLRWMTRSAALWGLPGSP